MRHNKEFTIIAREKIEEPTMQYHCAIHRSSRMRRFTDGLRCEACGGNEIAIKTIILNNPSSVKAERLDREKRITN